MSFCSGYYSYAGFTFFVSFLWKANKTIWPYKLQGDRVKKEVIEKNTESSTKDCNDRVIMSHVLINSVSSKGFKQFPLIHHGLYQKKRNNGIYQ